MGRILNKLRKPELFGASEVVMMKPETRLVRWQIGWWIVAGLTLAMIGGLVFTLLELNPLARKMLLEQTAPLFGENLTLGTVRFSPFKGDLTIKEITLKQAPGFGAGNLLCASKVRVKVDLKRLLKKELLIQQVTILSPEINFMQRADGRTNTEFYLGKILQNKRTTENDADFKLRLEKFEISNGRVKLVSYRLSEHQPALDIRKLQLRLANLQIPNPRKQKCRFSSSGMISAIKPVSFRITGNGVFQGETVNFDARTQLGDLALEEFTHLFPPADLTLKSGTLRMTADTHCEANQIVSRQQVAVRKLRVTPGKKGVWRKALFGLPANLFIKTLDDKDGMLNFDFELTGALNDLKVNLKEAIYRAVNRSLAKKFKPVSGVRVKKLGDITKRSKLKRWLR
jgi:hypothetical protein